MIVKEIEPGRWIAEGSYDDRYIVGEGSSRRKALFSWCTQATGGMNREVEYNESE